MGKEKEITLFGMKWYLFFIVSAVVLIAAYTGILPKGMVGAFPLMIILGTLLNLAGDHAPIIKSYFGGGAIVVIFVSAAMAYFTWLPEGPVTTVTNFMKGEGFLDFYIAALITGSILGMNRKLLIRAAIRYLPAILGGVLCAIALSALVGAVSGYGALKAVLYICIPIMGGGMGAGAVPLSQIFGSAMNTDPNTVLSAMIPAVALGNAMAIVIGGLLNRIGKIKKSWSGNGMMLRSQSNEFDVSSESETSEASRLRNQISLTSLGTGLFVSTSFMILGLIIAKLVPSIHYYAWMILSVVILKAIGIVPAELENACYQWYQFVVKNFTAPLLVGIGIAYTDMGQIISAFTPIYFVLVLAVVVGAVIGSGLMGRVVGFFPIESAVTAGLCMANMGGTGDVAVLSASDRMELMPFAQISSRLGGAFMLVLSSILLQIL